jgi:streptogramin lyase
VSVDPGQRSASDSVTATNRISAAPGFDWTEEFFPGGFAAGADAVWVSSKGDDSLLRLDPVTGEEIDRIRIGRTPGKVAVAGGAVWVASLCDGTVARYDLDEDLVRTIAVGGTPNDVVAARGSVWVAVEPRGSDQRSL